MAVHWITYFYSLQMSNVALGMLSLFTFPIITAFIEPLIFRIPFKTRHLIFGLIVLLGIYFLTPTLDIQNDYTKGILLGLLSAFCYALRNVIVKSRVDIYPGSSLMFFQLVIVAVLLIPTLFYFEGPTDIDQWSAIAALALFTTATGHTLFIMSLKNFSVSTASIMSSVTPIYGIIIAVIFINEIPSSGTIIGGALIISTVLAESYFANSKAD